jgi:hypothetical protein
MKYNFADFIDTRLQPGGNRGAGGEPFQRLARMLKTVETVLPVLRWLHPAEAGC